MKLCAVTAFALVLFPVGLTAQARAQDAKEDKDLKAFQGTWVLVGLEKDGEKAPDEKVKQVNLKVVVKGPKYTVKVGDKSMAGTFTLDSSKKPGHIDATATSPAGKEEKTVGIYELKGDTLRICFVPAGKDRPTEFRTQAGAGQTLEILRREKAD
jgi:uncharacterized protein (TIGR03067 family)